ncbi:MAG: quorum-sensing autoinducer synthase [Burkholderiales bacterium]|nr:MAG: quorum-sensing autoinducer synthase [Burkholderiales bacterium]
MSWSLASEAFPCDPALSSQLMQRVGGEFTDRWNRLWGGRSLVHGRNPSPNAVRLNGNDYLGITGHPDIVRAQMRSMQYNADFAIQSSVYMHGTHPIRDLERNLSQWIGKEDGLICQSGYTANLGLLQAIADESTPVYIDTLAHTSLWEGARAAKAPAQPFRHNDPAHLKRVIARDGPGIVVVDSVYSTTGAICPLADMVEVVQESGSMILVDESHTLGTHGPHGAGLCAELGLSKQVHFITASLAKTFAGRAGYFSMPAAMRYYLLVNSFPTIFSSCLLPQEIAGLAATLEVIKRSDKERSRLHSISRKLREDLSELGYPLHQGTEQILALESGTEPATMILRDLLEERDVFGAVFCAPATSRNRTMVRLTASSALTDAELERVVDVAAEIAPMVKPWEWPLARRAAVSRASHANEALAVA